MSRRFNLSAPLIVSVAALAVMVLLVLNQGPPLLMAALGPSGDGADPQATLTNLVDDHREDFEVYQERFNGRSFFFKPRPWPQPRRTPPPPPPPPDRTAPAPVPTPAPDPTPSAPATYTGPKILFVVGDSVWFESDRSTVSSFEVSVGQEKDGLRVIETNLPWSVKLGHAKGVYDVPIFERVDLFEGGTPTASTASKPRFPGLVDASSTTSRADTPTNEDDEAAGAEDPDESERDEEVASTDATPSTGPAATVDTPAAKVDESDAATPTDAVAEATEAAGEPVVAADDSDGTTPADAPPVATALRTDPDAATTEVKTEPLMGPPTREESTSSVPTETKTSVAAGGGNDVEPTATASAPPTETATEKPKTENPAKSAGDTAAPTPVVTPRPAPQKRPQGGRPAPEQRQGGRPAPEQQPAKSTGGGASGKPGKTDDSDTSAAGPKSSEEPSNADPGKE